LCEITHSRPQTSDGTKTISAKNQARDGSLQDQDGEYTLP